MRVGEIGFPLFFFFPYVFAIPGALVTLSLGGWCSCGDIALGGGACFYEDSAKRVIKFCEGHVFTFVLESGSPVSG